MSSCSRSANNSKNTSNMQQDASIITPATVQERPQLMSFHGSVNKMQLNAVKFIKTRKNNVKFVYVRKEKFWQSNSRSQSDRFSSLIFRYFSFLSLILAAILLEEPTSAIFSCSLGLNSLLYEYMKLYRSISSRGGEGWKSAEAPRIYYEHSLSQSGNQKKLKTRHIIGGFLHFLHYIHSCQDTHSVRYIGLANYRCSARFSESHAHLCVLTVLICFSKISCKKTNAYL